MGCWGSGDEHNQCERVAFEAESALAASPARLRGGRSRLDRGYAVEDFNYPQADQIFAEKGIRLKRGDGHIVLADCKSGTNQLEVWSYESVEAICFNVSGKSGWLTLEIPSVFGIRGNDFNTQVDMTTEGEEKSFDVEKNLWTAVGQTADEEGRDFALLEIRTSK